MRILKISIVGVLVSLLFSMPLLAGKGGGGWGSVSDSLEATEEDDLLFMREEEKLARDVYITFYEDWGTPIFNNISKSEQSHMDAIKNLLDKYDLTDPVGDNGVGIFEDGHLTTLYGVLIGLGTGDDSDNDLVDALLVGALIEEVDMEDLEVAIDSTDKSDIIRTYESLLCGSRNHLRAFVSQIVSRTGGPYIPQLKDDAKWDQFITGVVNDPMERCGRGAR